MADDSTRGLNEVQAAARAGFARFKHFQEARRLELFPPPLHELPGVGPVWSSEQIERFLGASTKTKSGREEAMKRLERAQA